MTSEQMLQQAAATRTISPARPRSDRLVLDTLAIRTIRSQPQLPSGDVDLHGGAAVSTLFYAVYDLQTGKVSRTGSCPRLADIDMLAAQVRPGEGVIETPEGQLDANAIVFDLASKRIAHLKF